MYDFCITGLAWNGLHISVFKRRKVFIPQFAEILLTSWLKAEQIVGFFLNTMQCYVCVPVCPLWDQTCGEWTEEISLSVTEQTETFIWRHCPWTIDDVGLFWKALRKKTQTVLPSSHGKPQWQPQSMINLLNWGRMHVNTNSAKRV